jgi:hypothetical protein
LAPPIMGHHGIAPCIPTSSPHARASFVAKPPPTPTAPLPSRANVSQQKPDRRPGPHRPGPAPRAPRRPPHAVPQVRPPDSRPRCTRLSGFPTRPLAPLILGRPRPARPGSAGSGPGAAACTDSGMPRPVECGHALSARSARSPPPPPPPPPPALRTVVRCMCTLHLRCALRSGAPQRATPLKFSVRSRGRLYALQRDAVWPSGPPHYPPTATRQLAPHTFTSPSPAIHPGAPTAAQEKPDRRRGRPRPGPGPRPPWRPKGAVTRVRLPAHPLATSRAARGGAGSRKGGREGGLRGPIRHIPMGNA